MSDNSIFAAFIVCLTILVISVFYIGTNFSYRTKIRMAQAGYEQVILPGHTSFAWQKVRSSK